MLYFKERQKGVKQVRHNLVQLIAKKEREENRRISVAKVARDAGLSPQALYNWLNAPGYVLQRVETDTIVKLCAYFECEINELLEMVEV